MKCAVIKTPVETSASASTAHVGSVLATPSEPGPTNVLLGESTVIFGFSVVVLLCVCLRICTVKFTLGKFVPQRDRQ